MSGATKRKNDDDCCQPEAGPSTKKPMKMPNAHEKPPTKLRHINFDCLVKIFEPLSVSDLMNIIVYDMALMEAARFVFEKKFAKISFHLSNKPLFDVNGKLCAVKYLKAFGCVIESLYFRYRTNYHEFDRLIEMAIIENCSKNLIHIRFRNAKCHSMNMLTEPFDKVQKVEFNESEFGEMIANFSQWFPNAHTLILDREKPQSYEYRRRLEKHHPALTHFVIKNNPAKQIEINKNSARKKLDNYNVSTFLKLNPQLRCIRIAEDGEPNSFGIQMDYELLTTIQKELKNLQELHLSFEYRPHSSSALPKINFRKLERLKLEMDSSSMLKYIPLSFGKIEHLSIKMMDVGSECLKFIRGNQNIRKLSLDASWKKMRYFFQFNDLLSTMPNLKEVYVMYQSQWQASNYVVELLNKCRKLDKLMIRCGRSQNLVMLLENLEHIAALVGPGWKANVCLEIDDHYALIIERKYDLVELD